MALWVASAVGSVIAGGAAARLDPVPERRRRRRLAARVRSWCLCAAGFALAGGVLSRSQERAERGRPGGRTRRGTLGSASRRVGPGARRSQPRGRLLVVGDERLCRLVGSPAAAARPPGRGRATTVIGTASDPIGILVHHPSVLDDPGLVGVDRDGQPGWPRSTLACRPRFAPSSPSWKRHDAGSSPPATRSTDASSVACVTARNAASKTWPSRLHRAAAGQRTSRSRADASQVAAHLAETLDELRTLAAGLHPRVLTERGLVGALEALAARNRHRHPGHGDGGRLPATLRGGRLLRLL